jgi:hypothetical protein
MQSVGQVSFVWERLPRQFNLANYHQLYIVWHQSLPGTLRHPAVLKCQPFLTGRNCWFRDDQFI